MLSSDKRCLKKANLIRVAKQIALGFLGWGAILAAHSQQTTAPPLPHSRPNLPGTHVGPEPIAQKHDIVLHVDGPFIVEQKRCQKDSFKIKYTVTNYSAGPANGTILATLNGAALTAIGSSKLSELKPGKAMTGAFSACCPTNGLFALRLEYRDEAARTQKTADGRLSRAFDSVNISCK